MAFVVPLSVFTSTHARPGKCVLLPMRVHVRTSHSTRTPVLPVQMTLGDASKTFAEFAALAGVIALAVVAINAQAADAAIFHFSGSRPTNLGVQYGRYLQTCPSTPNCVSSSANVVRNSPSDLRCHLSNACLIFNRICRSSFCFRSDLYICTT